MMGQHGVIAQQHGGSCGNAAHLIGRAFPLHEACTPRISWGCWAAADASLRRDGRVGGKRSQVPWVSPLADESRCDGPECVLRHRPR